MPDLHPSQIAQAQQTALLRLHLVVTAETHRLFGAWQAARTQRIEAMAGEGGGLAPESFYGISQEAAESWRPVLNQWIRLLGAARREAALLPFGAMALAHRAYFGAVGRRLTESGPPLAMASAEEGSPLFEPQIQAILDAAAARAYGDGLTLSARLWRLDAESLAGIQRTLYEALAAGDSAWNTARKLEQFLGASAACPRWTSTRLRLTKTQIAAGDLRGLVSGHPCEARGVAYNALRLARNEIQVVHHEATRLVMDRSPWVERVRVRLSPHHPQPDICDELAQGGASYPKETAPQPPFHVQCLCYLVADLPDEREFVGRLRAWMRGEGAWPEMDRYAATLQADRAALSDGVTEAVDAPAVRLRLALEQAADRFRLWLADDVDAMRRALMV